MNRTQYRQASTALRTMLRAADLECFTAQRGAYLSAARTLQVLRDIGLDPFLPMRYQASEWFPGMAQSKYRKYVLQNRYPVWRRRCHPL